MQLVKMVNRHLVVGVVVLAGTEDPQGAAHLHMGAIEALHGEAGGIAVHRPDRIEADPLITAHTLDLGVEVVRNDSRTRTIRNYTFVHSICWTARVFIAGCGQAAP